MSHPPELTKDHIHAAIDRLVHPAGGTIGQQNACQSVKFCDGLVKAVLVRPEHAGAAHALANLVASAVGRIEGVRSVELVWTDGTAAAAAAMGPAASPPAGAPSATSAGPGRTGTAPAATAIADQALPGVAHVIAVGAGKGGVGKSTVAALLAVGLARAGLRVGLMDADVYGPSIPKMLGLEGADVHLMAGNMLAPPERLGVKIMSIGLLVDPDKAMVWRGPMVHGVIKQFIDQVAWGELDFLIVDLPPGTGDVPLTLSQQLPLTGAVVVCTPQQVALLDARRAIRMYQTLKIDILGVVENMSYFLAPDTGRKYDLFGEGGARRAASELLVPFLGGLPIDMDVRISGDDGTPERLFEGRHPAFIEALDGVVQSLLGEVAAREAVADDGPQITVS